MAKQKLKKSKTLFLAVASISMIFNIVLGTIIISSAETNKQIADEQKQVKKNYADLEKKYKNLEKDYAEFKKKIEK